MYTCAVYTRWFINIFGPTSQKRNIYCRCVYLLKWILSTIWSTLAYTVGVLKANRQKPQNLKIGVINISLKLPWEAGVYNLVLGLNWPIETMNHVSVVGFDILLIVWCFCILSSQFCPQKSSTVTLLTVPGSKQWGATPVNTWQISNLYRANFFLQQKINNLIENKALCLQTISVFPCSKLSVQLTQSIRVGTWRVETLDTTRFAECVLGHVCVKCVCGYVVWSLWNRIIVWIRLICILNKCTLHSSSTPNIQPELK